MNIGEASKAGGVSQRMIRHYEQIGLIPEPVRRDSGYRDYGEQDVHRLRFIANARDLGFSVPEIKTLLDLWANRERASAEVKNLALRHIDELDEKIARLETMRDTLRNLARHCHGDERPDCPILHGLAADPASLSKGD
ncbi:Cu(I)-responsive transcriptional regulator [Altericroceibacterium spongiae]|uniref:Cu(I)-responsive transcriptional regulator n=1 Tax=Altericroceibacterium spongiae TaxID=2320269 RepID=A0A420EF08_9SPHN|nr:Cu(I)-responsive transcriptional regulator [Altericroceibacterium spongiae]RKF19262.1 Cu(I)-responsive transcriptional regulator [Altericroceibacterium spongiae]